MSGVVQTQYPIPQTSVMSYIKKPRIYRIKLTPPRRTRR